MRRIDELIWHCSATPPGWEKTVADPLAEIDSWHKARGWSGFGYHALVLEDGSVRWGRPAAQIGAHVAGRNAGTLGYCYAGGIDANDRRRARDTRTPAQKAAMLRLTREAIERYGVTMVSGHRDYDPHKACPCFDARAEYRHLLRRPRDGMPAEDPWAELGELGHSRTIGGAALAGAGAGGPSVFDELAAIIEPLSYYSSYARIVFVALTVIGILLVIYARWDDAGRKLPSFLARRLRTRSAPAAPAAEPLPARVPARRKRKRKARR